MKHQDALTTTDEQLSEALVDIEETRQALNYACGAARAHLKTGVREHRAAVKAEMRRRGLVIPKGRSFNEWAGVGSWAEVAS